MNSKLNIYLHWFFLLFAAFIASFAVLPPAAISIAIGLYLALFILLGHKNIPIRRWDFILILILLVFCLLSYFQSDNQQRYFKDMQHMIGFLIGGVIICSLSLNHSQLIKLRSILYITMSITFLFYFGFWLQYLDQGFSLYYKYNSITTTYHDLPFLSKIWHIVEFRINNPIPLARVLQDAYVPIGGSSFFYHHTYLGAFLVTLLFYSVFSAIENRHRTYTCILFCLLALFYIVWILFTESMTSRLSIVVAMISLIASYLYVKNKRLFFGGTALGLIVIIAVIYYLSTYPYFIEREAHSLEESLKYLIDYTRYELYHAIYTTIASNIWTGVGLGDIIYEVNSKLPTIHYTASIALSKDATYTTHSMFLYYFSGLGLFGFLAFFGHFLTLYIRAFMQFDRYSLTFLSVLIVSLSFEDFFIRIWGVLFYLIFMSYNHFRKA